MAPRKYPTCRRGHPFSKANTKLVTLTNGYTVRQCRRCRAIYDHKRYLTVTKPKRRAIRQAKQGATDVND